MEPDGAKKPSSLPLLIFFSVISAYFFITPLLQQKKIPLKPGVRLIIQEILIGNTRLEFTPTASTGESNQNTQLEFAKKNYLLQLKLLSPLEVNQERGFVLLTPAVNFSRPQIFLKDAQGNSWNFFPNQIVFKWWVEKQNTLYQRYLTSTFPYPPVKFETANATREAKSLLRFECAEGGPCGAEHAVFEILITVLGVFDQLPAEGKK